MPSITLDLNPIIPPSTSVSAYRLDDAPSGPPPTLPVETQTSSSAGQVTFTTLTAKTDYVAGAQVGGVWRYVQFQVPTGSEVAVAAAPFLVTGGNSGSAYTLDCTGHVDVLLTLTLTANCTVTITNRAAGGRVQILVTQDATGGRSLTISDGTSSAAVSIPTGPSAFGSVLCNFPDSTSIYASSLSIPGPQGIQGNTGNTGPTGPSGGGAAFVDPNNFSAVSADMLLVSATGNQPPSGQMVLTKVPVTVGFTCSKISVQIQTGGSGLTASQCFAGIYNSSGTLVGQTADQSAAWASAGEKSMALTGSVGLSAGFVWVALLANGTTRPTFFCASSSSLSNINSTGATARCGWGPASQTSLPASITPASISVAVPVFAIGLA